MREAINDLCLAQADVFYRPKDESIDKAIEALENQTSVIAELEKIKAEIKEEEEKGIYYECEEWIEGRPCDSDYFYGLLRAIMIIDKHIFELEGKNNG